MARVKLKIQADRWWMKWLIFTDLVTATHTCIPHSKPFNSFIFHIVYSVPTMLYIFVIVFQAKLFSILSTMKTFGDQDIKFRDPQCQYFCLQVFASQPVIKYIHKKFHCDCVVSTNNRISKRAI